MTFIISKVYWTQNNNDFNNITMFSFSIFLSLLDANNEVLTINIIGLLKSVDIVEEGQFNPLSATGQLYHLTTIFLSFGLKTYVYEEDSQGFGCILYVGDEQ